MSKARDEICRIRSSNVLKNLNVGIDYFQNAERKVVLIYVLAFTLPVLAALIARLPFIGQLIPYPFSTYAILWPLSTYLFAPFLVPFSLGPIRDYSSLTAELAVLIPIGFFALILFYPMVSYYLWHRHRTAWILSFSSSGATIGLEAYSISHILESAPLWICGIAINSLILFLLWSCKNEFLRRNMRRIR